MTDHDDSADRTDLAAAALWSSPGPRPPARRVRDGRARARPAWGARSWPWQTMRRRPTGTRPALRPARVFSLVLDRSTANVNPPASPSGSRSGWLIAVGAPALGLTYYRLRRTLLLAWPVSDAAGTDGNEPGPGEVRLDNLIDAPHRGDARAVAHLGPGRRRHAEAGAGDGRVGRAAGRRPRRSSSTTAAICRGTDSTKFDADLGVMASAGRLKAGLTAQKRDASRPSTAPGGGPPLKLERQARAGVALLALPGWLVAADMDLADRRPARSATSATLPPAPRPRREAGPTCAAASASTPTGRERARPSASAEVTR